MPTFTECLGYAMTILDRVFQNTLHGQTKGFTLNKNVHIKYSAHDAFLK